MLDTRPEPAVAEQETAAVLAKSQDETRAEDELTDDELADEVIVEISVDGMCGVY